MNRTVSASLTDPQANGHAPWAPDAAAHRQRPARGFPARETDPGGIGANPAATAIEDDPPPSLAGRIEPDGRLGRRGRNAPLGRAAACPRAFIVSGVRLVREALAQSLARSPRLRIVGATAPDEAAIAAVAARPDVVLLDMSTSANPTLARALIAARPGVKVIAFAVTESDQEVIACAQSGMAGYVSRDQTRGDLIAAVEHAMRGELRCTPRTAAMLFDRLGRDRIAAPAALDAALAPLTRRQREIYGLICDGLSNKAIARELGLSVATVKNHVHILLGRLQVSRGEAAARLHGRSM
jgi:two-component system, NarL family, nitrate/nitrite response regulator NarL